MDILFQSDEIRSYELVRLKLALADFVITPAVEDVSWAAFSQGERCIHEGEKAAVLAKKRRKHIFKKLLFG
jgi:hypothetical protein